MRFYLSIILFFVCLHVSATHIVGGEITYKYLSNNDYEIKLVIYRDCFNGVPPFDNPAHITVFSSSLPNVELDINGFVQSYLPNTINNPCIIAPPNICYERAEYTTTINLPPTIGGYYIIYQTCCRNNTITNIPNPNNSVFVGSTFLEHIPGSETNAWQNTSPKFNNLPPTFVCANTPFIYNSNAQDIDGDSLVYDFADAYDGCTSGLSSCLPYPTPNFGLLNLTYPINNYAFGYSGINPFGSAANIIVQPSTGIMSGIATQIGQFVVVIQAKEYRNGQLIGIHRRDYQFNITPCNKNIFSSVINVSNHCSSTVNFQVSTFSNTNNPIEYLWDFADTTSGINNASIQKNPTHVFSSLGTYQVRLITYDSLNQACKDTVYKTIKVLDTVSANFLSPTPLCKNSPGNFAALVLTNPNFSNYSYYWNFGDPVSGANNFSSLPNLSHRFTDTGTYNVRLIVIIPNSVKCVDTIIKTIQVKEYVKSDFTLPNYVCKKQPVQILNNSYTSNLVNPLIYNWTFTSANLSTSNLVSPNPSYNSTGLFNIKLVVKNPDIVGCKDSITKQVQISKISIQSIVPTNLCNQLTVPFLAKGDIGKTIRYRWDFGDTLLTTDTSTLINAMYSYPAAGVFKYTLIGIDSANNYCTDTVKSTVSILDVITPDFNSAIPYCTNLPVKFKTLSSHLGNGTLNYKWQIAQINFTGDSLIYSFPDSGSYNILFTATSNLHPNCSSTISKTIKTYPKLIASLLLDNVYCVATQIKSINLSKGSLNPAYEWKLNGQLLAAGSRVRTPVLSFSKLGANSITMSYRDSLHPECIVTTSKNISIQALPEITLLTTQDKCNGGEIEFEAQVVNKTGNPSNVSWEFSDGTIDNGNKIKHIFPLNGSYTNYAIVSIPQIKYCVDTSEIIKVEVNNRGDLFIPNAFSPNNDNNNDYFKIEGPLYDVFEMHIFNRFGEEIFESTDQLFGWNGKIKNSDAETGVYAYYVKVKCPNGMIESKKGNLTLIR
jgi:gliding motility-associated-like protein